MLERKDLLAGDSALMVEFAVFSTQSLPEDSLADRTTVMPESMRQTHEWDKFVVEVWVRGEGPAPVEVHDLKLDLGYRTDLTSAVNVEFGRSFQGAEGTFELDDSLGQVRDIHGISPGVEVSNQDRVLFARVHFQAVPQLGDNVRMDFVTGSVGPHSVELATQNITAMSGSSDVLIGHDPMPELGLLPVIYDLNEDQKISLSDFGSFVEQFGKTADSPTDGVAWFADFDKSYKVGLSDYGYFVANFGKNYDSEFVTFPANYPSAWIEATEPTDDGGDDGGVTVVDPDDDKDPPAQPLPQFNLGLIGQNMGINLPGVHDVFQIVVAGINWQDIQISRLTGNASLSEEGEEVEGDVVLSIVLEDEEIYETEIELIFDGELIDTLTEFNEYSVLITSYVSEVMTTVKGLLSDALDGE